jgi:hypothetical protein
MEKTKAKMEMYLQRNVESYLHESGMRNDGVWATETEILSAASFLKTDIVVYSQYGNSMKWLQYPASLSLSDLTHDALFLSNESGTHFDVVLSA